MYAHLLSFGLSFGLALCLVVSASLDENAQRPHGVLSDLVRQLAAWLDELDPHDAETLRRILVGTNAKGANEEALGEFHKVVHHYLSVREEANDRTRVRTVLALTM